MSTDTDLHSLRNLIRNDESFADQSIEVTVGTDHKLTLRGTVDHLSDKLRVQELVTTAAGEEVDNYLTISHSDSERVIFENVCTTLEEHPDVPNEVVSVRVSGDVVILRGYVHSAWIRLLIADVVRAVPGVGEVINVLTVSPNHASRDASSGHRISQALNARLRDCVLRVAVDGEMVQVSGIIGRAKDEEAVEQILAGLGARRVQNKVLLVHRPRAS